MGSCRRTGLARGEILYRLLSAATHGYQWVVLPMGQSEALGSGGLPGLTMMRVTANDQYTLRATEVVVGVCMAALGDLEAYAEPRRA